MGEHESTIYPSQDFLLQARWYCQGLAVGQMIRRIVFPTPVPGQLTGEGGPNVKYPSCSRDTGAGHAHRSPASGRASVAIDDSASVVARIIPHEPAIDPNQEAAHVKAVPAPSTHRNPGAALLAMGEGESC